MRVHKKKRKYIISNIVLDRACIKASTIYVCKPQVYGKLNLKRNCLQNLGLNYYIKTSLERKYIWWSYSELLFDVESGDEVSSSGT